MTGLKGARPAPSRYTEEKPEKITDLVGQEIEVHLQGDNPLRSDDHFKARLDYVMRGWIGVSWIYHGRLHRDHLPTSNVRTVKKVKTIRRRKPTDR